MKKCILCETNKENVEFNKEHVIPRQLGGSLTIKNLCEDCNSKVGEELDEIVAENLLFKIYKNNEKIKSNSGNYINPFKNFISEENKNRELEIGLDEEGNLKIQSIPHTEPTLEIKNKTSDGKATAVLTTEASIPLEDLDRIFNELTNDLNVELSPKSQEKIKSGKIDSKIINHEETFLMKESVDTWPIVKLFVRIAYEIAFYMLGDDYFNDPMKDKLKNYLESKDEYIEDLEDRYGINIHFIKKDEINEAISHLAKATYKDDNLLHYITILPAQINGIMAINLVVTLFNRLSANILISEDFNRYEINDLNVIMMFKNNENKYTKEFPKN